jgi:pimeloyl-ACP methyl ester carboxylesterase
MAATSSTSRRSRAGRTAVVGGLVLGGAALGFLAERRFVRRRLGPPAAPLAVPLGSIAGEVTAIEGPEGDRIIVETYGPPDAPQLLLSHGWICTGRVWHEQVARLSDRFRIVTYDQPGHGRTPAPSSGRYDLDLLGDTLARVVQETTRPGPLVVAGHSMGGMAVLNAVRRHPEVLADRLAGVVLMSTTSSAKAEKLTLEIGIQAAARLERGIRRVVPTLRHPRVLDASHRLTAATSDLSYLVTRWTSSGPDADPAVVAFTQQLALDSGPDVVLGLVEAVLGVDEDESLTCLTVPTTIVVGTHDKLTPLDLSRRMAARCDAELVELPRIGHMCPLEAPEEVTAVLLGHLDRAVSSSEAAS